MTTTSDDHAVVPGSITDRFGHPWLQSEDRFGLYPLGAECSACGPGRTCFVKVAPDSAWDHWRQPIGPTS